MGRSTHPVAERDPTLTRPLGPAMFAVQAFRHLECSDVDDLVRHDASVTTDRTSAGIVKGLRGRAQSAALPSALDGNGFARQHALDARAFGAISFAQVLAVAWTGQAFATAPDGPPSNGRLAPREARLGSMTRVRGMGLGRFASIHSSFLRPSFAFAFAFGAHPNSVDRTRPSFVNRGPRGVSVQRLSFSFTAATTPTTAITATSAIIQPT
jgi:hypothetical protein